MSLTHRARVRQEVLARPRSIQAWPKVALDFADVSKTHNNFLSDTLTHAEGLLNSMLFNAHRDEH